MKINKIIKMSLPVVTITPLVSFATVACRPSETTGFSIVSANGSETYYDTFKNACNHLNDGDTLKFHEDLSITNPVTITDKGNISFDGDGHTIMLKTVGADTPVLAFTNCKGISLNNLSISASTLSMAGVGVLSADKGTDINFNNVNVIGNYINPVLLYGNVGGTIDNCNFASNVAKDFGEATLRYEADSKTLTISNSFIDSIDVQTPYDAMTSKKLVLQDGTHTRYITVDPECTKESFAKGIKIGQVDGFLFGGFETDGGFYESLMTEDDVRAMYIPTADALYSFNEYYSQPTLPEFSGIKFELHLMNDISCDADVYGSWIPLISGYNAGVDHFTWSYNHSISKIDGHGHTISNLLINQQRNGDIEYNDIGFLSWAEDIEIKDITFDNCRLEVVNHPQAGMLIGRLYGHGNLSNVTVSNSYIGAIKKVGSFVGVVRGPGASTYTDCSAWLTISGCKSDNCTVVNKAKSEEVAGDVDVYLGGLAGWVAFDYGQADTPYEGMITIDTDPTKPTIVHNLHFNWQQESEEWTTKFEVAVLFLYGRAYRHCDMYENVIVSYEGE